MTSIEHIKASDWDEVDRTDPADEFELQPAVEDDAIFIYEWIKDQDPDYVRKIGPASIDHFSSEAKIRSLILNPDFSLQAFMHDGEVVGFSFARFDDATQNAEIGFIIDQKTQGKGFAKELVSALSREIFDGQHNTNKLTARVARNNKYSANALYANGFNMTSFEGSKDNIAALIFERPKNRGERGYRIGYLTPRV